MAQAANQPFKFQEVFNLSTKGLDPANFKMGLMTFESQKYICVKEGAVSRKRNATGFTAISLWSLQTLQKFSNKLLNMFCLFNSKSPSSTLPAASASNAET